MCQVSLPQQEQVLYNFCLCSCINNSCMEEESVGVTYNKLVVSKAGDFIVHMSHMVYFSKTNENRSSENDPLLFILSLVGHGPNTLSMISISNMRHSQASSCISPVKIDKTVARPRLLYTGNCCAWSLYWNATQKLMGILISPYYKPLPPWLLGSVCLDDRVTTCDSIKHIRLLIFKSSTAEIRLFNAMLCLLTAWQRWVLACLRVAMMSDDWVGSRYWEAFVITFIIKCGMKLLILSQTSTVAPLKFGNG